MNIRGCVMLKKHNAVNDLCSDISQFSEIIRCQNNYISFLESMIADSNKSKLYVLKRMEFYETMAILEDK